MQPQKSPAGNTPPLLWALPMLLLLALPVVALVSASSFQAVLSGIESPVFLSALWLSLKTSLLSLVLLILLGTPLAWWMAFGPERPRRFVELLVDLPVVIPPAVLGIALLQTFGRQGLLGGVLEALNLSLPFSTTAVIIAQMTAAAPFYVQSACTAFRRVDPDLIWVARTLGQTSRGAFRRVVLPLATPGIITGVALAWARALGEFGATLLFAGNLPGETQTLPLAIYATLESDVQTAVAIALVMLGGAVCLLLALRLVPKSKIGVGGRNR